MNSKTNNFNPFGELFPTHAQAEAFRKAKMLLAEHFVGAVIIAEFEVQIDEGVVGTNHVVGFTAGTSAAIGLIEKGKKAILP